MEKNVEKETIPTTDYDKSKKTEECGIRQELVWLGAIFTCETESRISMAKVGFNKNKAIFACKFDVKYME